MHDLDQAHAQLHSLHARCKSQQDNLATLTGTLTETQNELEGLVAEHERLGHQARELQTLAEKYKQASEQAMGEVRQMRQEATKARE